MLYVVRLPLQQVEEIKHIHTYFCSITNRFRVRGHFEASALNDAPNNLETSRSKVCHVHVMLIVHGGSTFQEVTCNFFVDCRRGYLK